jgi:hypothetical protein
MFGMLKFARSYNQRIGNWNTSSATDLNFMFHLTESFDQPLGTSTALTVRAMIADATAFNQPLADWDVSNVVDMWKVSTALTCSTLPSATGTFRLRVT